MTAAATTSTIAAGQPRPTPTAARTPLRGTGSAPSARAPSSPAAAPSSAADERGGTAARTHAGSAPGPATRATTTSRPSPATVTPMLCPAPSASARSAAGSAADEHDVGDDGEQPAADDADGRRLPQAAGVQRPGQQRHQRVADAGPGRRR